MKGGGKLTITSVLMNKLLNKRITSSSSLTSRQAVDQSPPLAHKLLYLFTWIVVILALGAGIILLMNNQAERDLRMVLRPAEDFGHVSRVRLERRPFVASAAASLPCASRAMGDFPIWLLSLPVSPCPSLGHLYSYLV
jgi:hypothetical protein